MPLYIADYLADTAHLGALQSGAYLHLIMHYWQNGGLPTADAALARIARLSPAEWRRERETLSAFFQDGWKHKRIDNELASASNKIAARSAAGALGGRAKWGDAPRRQHGETRSQRLSAARNIATHTANEWTALCEVFERKCVRCGASPEKVVKDHILPIYQGGSDGVENLQPLCASCNSSKGAEAIDFRQNVLPDWPRRLSERLANANQTPAPSQPHSQTSSLRSDDARAERDAIDAEFDRDFWPAYPNKVGKPAARKAFHACRKRAELPRIMAGLERYVREKPGDRAWLNPATFLNQDRFDDQPASPPEQSAKPTAAGTGDAFRGSLARIVEARAQPGGGADDGVPRLAGPAPGTGAVDDDLEIPGFLRRQ
jgi:uncharacterized protein YdaU (DUF1376 family)